MKLLACIVETRYEQELLKAIDDHIKMLPDNVELRLYTGENNGMVISHFPPECCYNAGIKNEHEYNKLLTSPEFWESMLDYDRVLIFQTDSVLFRPGVEEFYEWDYVGAPWKFQDHGGNGGLSLRNPKVMHEICTRVKWEPYMGNEDVFFSNILYKEKCGKLAPREVCSKFSVESIFAINTFGGHAYWKYIPEHLTKQIKYQYE